MSGHIGLVAFDLDGTLLHGDTILEGRGGLVCLNSAARFDKWNRAAVR